MKINVFLFLLILSFSNTYSQRITFTGNLTWAPIIPNTLISEAGNDYSGTISSAANQIFIRIRGLNGSPWRVDISKSDTNWNSSLILRAQRTGNGIGGFGISGGTIAQTITNFNTPFFSGNNNINSIPIQFHITGYSLLIPAGTYSSSVIFTLIDL